MMKKTVIKSGHKKKDILKATLTIKNSMKLFYVSAALFILALSSLISAVIIQQRKLGPVNSPVPFAGYSVNVPITMGLATVEVTNVSFSDGQPGSTAASDMRYAIVDFVVKNNADKPINVLPSSDTYIKSDSGVVSYLTPFNLEQPFRAGALLPGEQIKGQLSYLTAKKGSTKLFVDSVWIGGVVSFKIQ